MKLTEFELGYVIACANLVNLHDQPGMAADVMSALGVSWKQIEIADLTDYDMRALREIKREKSVRPFVDGRTKAGRRALESQT